MNKTFKFVVAAIAFIAGSMTSMTSCTDYQDEIDALRARIDTLAILEGQAQDNLNNLSDLINAIENNWYIEEPGYMPIYDNNGKQVGYTINLIKIKYDPKTGTTQVADRKTIEIRNGANGADAEFPTITPRQAGDGKGWYWVIIRPDGTEEPLTDEYGNPVVVAKDGENGKDATAPQIRVNPTTDPTDPHYNEWQTSIDGGKTWQDTGVKVTGDKGDKGDKGDDVKTAIIEITIKVDSNGGKYTQILLASGDIINLPYYDPV